MAGLGDVALGDVALGDVALGDVALAGVALGDVALGDVAISLTMRKGTILDFAIGQGGGNSIKLSKSAT